MQPVQLQIAVRTHARCGRAPVGGTDMLEMYCVKGLRRWYDRFGQYGIKVCYWGSGTLKIVIYVENHPQKRSFWLADYHPPL